MATCKSLVLYECFECAIQIAICDEHISEYKERYCFYINFENVTHELKISDKQSTKLLHELNESKLKRIKDHILCQNCLLSYCSQCNKIMSNETYPCSCCLKRQCWKCFEHKNAIQSVYPNDQVTIVSHFCKACLNKAETKKDEKQSECSTAGDNKFDDIVALLTDIDVDNCIEVCGFYNNDDELENDIGDCYHECTVEFKPLKLRAKIVIHSDDILKWINREKYRNTKECRNTELSDNLESVEKFIQFHSDHVDDTDYYDKFDGDNIDNEEDLI